MQPLEMDILTSGLHNLQPEHDTPVGLIHPYWARKPLNIVQELVKRFSESGDLIVDPFVGSGTTVFAALSTNRRVIGSDLNPLAVFITRAIISLSQSPEQKLASARRFVADFSATVLPWYYYRDNLYVERERFRVQGEFENGNFQLIPIEVVLKTIEGGKARGRIIELPSRDWIENTPPESLVASPIDFRKLSLVANSRIAIPSGASLDHYYELKNQASINAALKLIQSGVFQPDEVDILKLMLSASLPLLRLSDKKASTQWPYWRPKDQLTSRNPVPIMWKKLQAIERAAIWLNKNLSEEVRARLAEYLELYTSPVQSVLEKHITPGQADLVLTDPPYSDQAPYLEYSSLWIQLLGLPLPKDANKYEIVKTDAPGRVEDSRQYALRLSQGLKVCADILKVNGTLIWFYQDRLVQHWAVLSELFIKYNLHIVDVVPLEKQRRSMKTVTSPGKTLDGDLILVFRKEESHNTKNHKKLSVAEAIEHLELALSSVEASSNYFEKYSVVVKTGLKENLMTILGTEYTDIREILKAIDKRNNHVLAS